jgi:hypothetical protein
MTIPIYGPEELRRAVCFTDLTDPLRMAFGEFSNGRAQQTTSTTWPASRPEDGNVLIKAGCITGNDIFVVKAAPWFGSNQTAGRPQGGIVTAFDASTGHRLNVPGARLYCERRGGGRWLRLVGSPVGSTRGHQVKPEIVARPVERCPQHQEPIGDGRHCIACDGGVF